jgi:hypothetical protein
VPTPRTWSTRTRRGKNVEVLGVSRAADAARGSSQTRIFPRRAPTHRPPRHFPRPHESIHTSRVIRRDYDPALGEVDQKVVLDLSPDRILAINTAGKIHGDSCSSRPPSATHHMHSSSLYLPDAHHLPPYHITEPTLIAGAGPALESTLSFWERLRTDVVPVVAEAVGMAIGNDEILKDCHANYRMVSGGRYTPTRGRAHPPRTDTHQRPPTRPTRKTRARGPISSSCPNPAL